MQVTDVRIRRIQTDGKLRAYVSITFDDSFVVHDLRIIDGRKGMFVAMPSKLLPNGNHKDIAHPINTEVREMIQNAVLKEYQATEQEAKASGGTSETSKMQTNSSAEYSDDLESMETEKEEM
ncbi:MAG: septation regulator SpoVG [Candidatus Caldatribacteriota bacterium]